MMNRGFLLLAAAVIACLGPAPAATQQQPRFQAAPAPATGRSALPAKSIAPAELLSELRKGGYVLYFRHTSTDFSRDDAKSRSGDDCANQRLLTDKGREEARQIGAAIRDLKIPVGQVLASPRCRTMETALLIFGRAEKANEVRGGPATPDNPDRYAALRRLLTAPVKPRTNLAISSHGNPFYATAGAPYLEEGEAAVVRPLGMDFAVVARLKHDAWRALGR